MKKAALITILSLAALLTAYPAASTDTTTRPASQTTHRTDFTAEEFGIGREHTGNAACNRKIDKLLDEIRVCINTRPEAECVSLRKYNNQEIGKLKFSRHCAR